MDSPDFTCTWNVGGLVTMAFINKHVACSSFQVVYYHICCRQCLAADSIFCQNPLTMGLLTSHLRLSAVSCREKTVVKKCRTIIGE